ncbi:MAG: hypothetical protein KDE04_19350, partial [Anaerolineales bacterium]|nr:hypothetical protein [Anaerolineales bacterium]
MVRQLFIRLWAVVRKEVVELLRQNRLILTLVIGPFLILSLFGLGFRNESPTRDVILLDPFGTGLQDEVEAFIPNLGDAVNLVATTTDAVQAEELLKNQTVDLVIIPPQDAIGSIRNSEHAEITILHSEIDPFEQATVNVLGRLAADRINQEILTRAADQSKTEAAAANESVDTTRDHTSAMRTALETGDEERAQTELLALQQETDQLAMAVYASLQETAGLDSLNETGANPLLGTTTSLQEQVSNFVINGDDDYTDELASLDQIEADLADVEVALE